MERSARSGRVRRGIFERADPVYLRRMPTSLNLELDPETARQLIGYMDHDIALGRFGLQHDRVFVLDANGGDPGRTSLINDLKSKFTFIDFDGGGLKVLDLDIRGSKARFSVIPRWEMPAPGEKGFGGPSIGLRFSMTW
jgi:hypothetical protein